MYFWWYWVVIGVCTIFSAFFSAADCAYGMVDKDKLKRLKDKGSKRAGLALYLADKYEFSIATILFGNNIVNILASSLVTAIAMALNADIGPTIGTICFTIFIVIFGEFMPKAFAKRFNFKLALLFAYPVRFFEFAFIIFVWPISKFFELFGRIFHKRSKEEDKIDEDVLTEMVDEIEEDGQLEEGEAELVRSAIDLNDIQAFEIMTPRVDVFAINVDDDIDEILKDEELFVHSRIPVYEDTIDNIIGVVPVKAIGKCLLNHQKVDLRALMYKPLIIPRNHQILDLLSEFKKSRVHIAIVIDEYGGTEGIITMEDILEEIVGDIFDETDKIEEQYVVTKDGKMIADGSMNIDDFFEEIGYEEEFETDYSTVGGFCQEMLDRFAKKGDEFDFGGYHFKVLEADDFTVEKLEVSKIEKDKEDD